jgi:DNA-directed RNA polymerase specialized sigma24 family protein
MNTIASSFRTASKAREACVLCVLDSRLGWEEAFKRQSIDRSRDKSNAKKQAASLLQRLMAELPAVDRTAVVRINATD